MTFEPATAADLKSSYALQKQEQGGGECDVLGKTQWEWLENELRSSNADLHILILSVQFLESRTRLW